MKRIEWMRGSSSRPALAVPLGVIIALSLSAGGCKKEKGGSGKGGNPTTQTAGTQPADQVATSPYDISANPLVLADPAVTPTQYELYGIKLGDPRSALVASGISANPDESGWVGHRGQDEVFRLEDDKVVALRVADDAILLKLGLRNEQDVPAKFGEPSSPVDADPKNTEILYTYKDRDMTVLWNRKAAPGGKVITIGS
jgi:hypothetical protein